MRKFIDIVKEQADADDMYGDSSVLHTFGKQDGQEFSDRGRGNVKPRANMDARFADNPMDDEQLDEFMDGGDQFNPDPTQLDKLHSALTRAGQSDQSIMQGITLTDRGKQKLAASLGLSPQEIGVLLSSLSAKLSKDDSRSTDALIDDYYTTMGEGADAPMVIHTMERRNIAENDSKRIKCTACKGTGRIPGDGLLHARPHGKICSKCNGTGSIEKKPAKEIKSEGRSKGKLPFNQGTIMELLSYEADALGNVTIRDLKSGNEKYIQGTQATMLLAKLRNGADPDTLLGPLMESNVESSKSDFMDEIEASSGTYNFPWRFGGKHGLATVLYHAVDKPSLELISVRDDVGIDVEDVDTTMRNELMQQAKDFIGHE